MGYGPNALNWPVTILSRLLTVLRVVEGHNRNDRCNIGFTELLAEFSTDFFGFGLFGFGPGSFGLVVRSSVKMPTPTHNNHKHQGKTIT